MAVLIIAGTAAVFGILYMLWAAAGWSLGGCDEGVIVCQCGPDGRECAFLERVLLLRRAGLLGTKVVLVDRGMTKRAEELMKKGDFACVSTMEALMRDLELERKEID